MPISLIVKNSVRNIIETEFLEINKIYNHLQETIPSLLSKAVIISIIMC